MIHMLSLTRVALTPLAAALALAASTAPAAAADIEPGLKAAMQRDMGLDDPQLGQYLRTQRVALQQAKAVEDAHGLAFAGMWIERVGNSFRVVAASTAGTARKSIPGVEVRQARHNLAALNTAKARLDAVRAPRDVYGWAVDLPTNTVTVHVAPGAEAAAIDFVAASSADASTIRFVTMGDAPRPLVTLQGGSEYLSSGPEGSYYCSVGFGVNHGTGHGYATAGHCGAAGDVAGVLASRRSANRIGAFVASSFPGDDMAWVRLDAGHSVVPVVDGYKQADVAVRGATVAPVGATVCRSGRTTGWRCGAVQAYNATVNYSGDVVNGLTHVKVCAEGGDSGGSFIDGTGQAQGVLSGGNYSCKGNQANLANSYFQPIGEILQTYNLTLLVSP